MSKIILLFNTIKFLKFIQIYYRLFYFLRSRIRLIVGFHYPQKKASKPIKLVLNNSLYTYNTYAGDNKFEFLNIKHDFKENIDWNHERYGKLWTYNLNYFDFLNQKTASNYIEIIEDFIFKQENISIGFEPFPIALRGINWIKYLTYNNIDNQVINDNLYAQYYRLKDNLEYHLLGNHLLENAFSLLFGAYYFQDEILYNKAKQILENELEEQVLGDGGHFELSPMYHQIMLFRLLDVINLLQNNKWKDEKLLMFLIEKSKLMLAWLKNITYINGDIPLLNDSTRGIAPSSQELFKYAKLLDISFREVSLKNSGYRKIVKKNYEAIIDIGSIGASYIPGHAHSDSFNFEVYKENKPFIVDTGLSTYETNTRRTIERSTHSHNTVEVNSLNQTQVWGGFRVANRANIIFLEEKEDYIMATHDGYKQCNILHTRKWVFEEKKIFIEDTLSQTANATAYIHFHPSINKKEIEKAIEIERHPYELVKYEYAQAFNNLTVAWCIKIIFNNKLRMKINLL